MPIWILWVILVLITGSAIAYGVVNFAREATPYALLIGVPLALFALFSLLRDLRKSGRK